MIALIAIAIMLIYLLLIGVLTYCFDKVEDFKLQDLQPKTKFSIVIPFRNEVENLHHLLTSISELNYPKSMFEVILVDDASEDESVKVIKEILDTKSFFKDFIRTDGIKIIRNKRTSTSPKKDAITSAIKVSSFEWIITTDADCILPKYWLDTFDEYIQIKNFDCIVAPVTYLGEKSFFNRFQTLDFLSLQGATIGGFGLNKPFMCNGANFGYRKSLFQNVKGFDGNTNVASGDDIFLLEKFIKYNPEKVHYLKSNKAVVSTNPASTISHLIQQRLRWASKTRNYNNWFAKLVGLVVLLSNLVCLALIPLLLFKALSPRIAVALFIIKFSIDFLLLFKTARFFKQESILLSYLFSGIIYPFFSVYIAIVALFKSYKWKGRTFNK